MAIYEKLMQVQQGLKAPKGQYNSHSKFYYRSCEDILEAVKPLLAKAKVTLTIADSIEMVGDRIYIKATATFTDAESGEQFQNVAFAREAPERKGMDAAQITGAASSYARKYALNGLFCIDDSKDADTNEYGNQQSAPMADPICIECENPVTGMKKKDGTVMTPIDIYNACNGLCFACYKRSQG